MTDPKNMSLASLEYRKRKILKSIQLVTDKIHKEDEEEALLIKRSLIVLLQPVCFEIAVRTQVEVLK